MISTETNTRGIEALYALGHWLLEQGNYRDAASILRTMVQVAPTDERGWLALGVCHEQADQLEVAVEMYGAGSALCAGSARCALARARALRAIGEYDLSTESYDAAAEAATDDEDLLLIIESERVV